MRKELASELADKARVKEPDADKMFINVLGGKKGDPSLEVARGELKELGTKSKLSRLSCDSRIPKTCILRF